MLDHGRRHGVPGARGELIHVERKRLAGAGGGQEVRVLLAVVERVVGRPDHGHGVGLDASSVGGEPDRFGSGLRPAVDRDGETGRPLRQEQLGRPHALLRREQDALAGRSEREDPVEAPIRQECGHRPERVAVECGPAVSKRRHRRRERSREHGGNSSPPRGASQGWRSALREDAVDGEGVAGRGLRSCE